MKLLSFVFLALFATAFAQTYTTSADYAAADAATTITIENLRGHIIVEEGDALNVNIQTVSADDEAAITINADNTDFAVAAELVVEDSSSNKMNGLATALLLGLIGSVTSARHGKTIFALVLLVALLASAQVSVDPDAPSFLQGSATVLITLQVPAGFNFDDLDLRAAGDITFTTDVTAKSASIALAGTLEVDGFTLDNSEGETMATFDSFGDMITIGNFAFANASAGSILFEATAEVNLNLDASYAGSYEIDSNGGSIQLRGDPILRLDNAAGDYPSEEGIINDGGDHLLSIASEGSVTVSVGGATSAAPMVTETTGEIVIQASCEVTATEAEEAAQAPLAGVDGVNPNSIMFTGTFPTDTFSIYFTDSYETLAAARAGLDLVRGLIASAVTDDNFLSCSIDSYSICGNNVVELDEVCDGDSGECCTYQCTAC